MKACKKCKNTQGFSEGIKGKNADSTKILLIANYADSRINQQALFGNNHEAALYHTRTGEILRNILRQAHLTMDDVYFTNIVKCIFVNDPNETVYANCMHLLEKQVREFQPRKIVAFGEKVYSHLFPHRVKNETYEELWYNVLEYQGASTLIAPHPSKIWAKINHEKIDKECKNISDFL